MKISITLILTIMSTSLVGQTGVVDKPAPTEEKPTLTEKPTLPNSPIPDKPKPPSDTIKDAIDEPLVDFKLELDKVVLENNQLKQKVSNLESELKVTSNQSVVIQNMKLEQDRLKTQLGEVTTKLESANEEKGRYFIGFNNASNDNSILKDKIIQLESAIVELKGQSSGLVFSGWSYIPDLGWIFASNDTMPYFYVDGRGWAFAKVEGDEKLFFFFDKQEWVSFSKK